MMSADIHAFTGRGPVTETFVPFSVQLEFVQGSRFRPLSGEQRDALMDMLETVWRSDANASELRGLMVQKRLDGAALPVTVRNLTADDMRLGIPVAAGVRLEWQMEGEDLSVTLHSPGTESKTFPMWKFAPGCYVTAFYHSLQVYRQEG